MGRPPERSQPIAIDPFPLLSDGFFDPADCALDLAGALLKGMSRALLRIEQRRRLKTV
jgi:hypothetical protein